MFIFSPTVYIIVIILQLICVVHCLRKGNQGNWLWLIIFLPLIGCLIYFFTEIVNSRDIKSVQSGVGEIFNPSGSIKKLEEKLRFSDTFNNRVALADAYLEAGQTARAISLYESSLTGAFTENEYAIARLLIAYYAEKRYEDVLAIAPRISKLPQFQRSKAHILYAMSLGYTGREAEAEKEFQGLNGRFSNFEARYYYALFLENQDRKEEAKRLLQQIVEEVPQLSGVEKKHYREWIGLSKDMLKRIQAS